MFQSNDDSIISLSHAKQELIAGINDLHFMADNNSETKKFLASTICDDGNACDTIQGYEQSRTVTWQKTNGLEVTLESKACGTFDKLSDVKSDYLDTILSGLDDYFPEIQVMDFDILDQRMW